MNACIPKNPDRPRMRCPGGADPPGAEPRLRPDKEDNTRLPAVCIRFLVTGL